MADLNVSLAVDLKSIKKLGLYTTDSDKDSMLNNNYVHLLSLNGNKFEDYVDANAIISKANIGDRVNWTVFNYSEYNSALSVVLVNLTLDNPPGREHTILAAFLR
ncbi:hypothetical protein HZS38_08590 [Xenorhabdus nematophila]|uniref:AidA/PixA family protein n=1 Tax=Xenorhabdus nematophila TaxID=628 RepID=UPI00054288B6|nr:AidA/PixA family protein [Xenorhabdus nematophila]CEF33758.1 hypothetical protein XNW1_4920008 [Xenorhabdus nematophila str. Websteri]KHD28498.1 hypothetical protein LH67_09795 [Xenorhabdus nematophila]MBA0019200.1 hypothetical protein [Xenorhabdus nematophila]MCB4425709.1 hypothetical protein [Xenorhabdus nematophila]QNJ38098.1 hypothetical protein H8F46_08275 [Xenorhabdus nematophila]